MGFFSPLPCPPARPSGCKGARNARKPATNPCSATGASGSHLRSFASHASLGKAGANGKSDPKAGTIRGPNRPTCARDFPSLRTGPVSPQDRDRCGSDRNSPSVLGVNLKTGTAPPRTASQPHPSGGSPLAVPSVNLGHEDGPERELALPCLPRQFAQIAAC